MGFPLSTLTAVSSAHPWTYLVFGLIGFAFGFTLEMSGFGDSQKLAAQFYFKDMTVLKVMFTGIVVAAVLIFLSSSLGLLNYDRLWVNPTYLYPGIVGGLIMGVGFIVGGFCPGTSLVAASTLKLDGIVFVLGGLFGVWAFGEMVGSFENFFNSSFYGRLTLFDWLGKNGFVDKPALRQWEKVYLDKKWLITAVRCTAKGAGDRTLEVPTMRLSFKIDAPFFPYTEVPADPADEASFRAKYNQGGSPYAPYSYGSRPFDAYVVATTPMQSMIGATTASPHPDVISLPNGFQPEGIASGPGTTFFVRSVATGAIYGPYHYTNQLGPKLGHVPLLIPIAWFMLIYPSYVIANLIADGQPTGTRGRLGRLLGLAFLSAMVMTAWFSPYARLEGGLAAPFLDHLSWVHVLVSTSIIALALVFGFDLLHAAVVLLSSLTVLLAVWASCRTWFGGITGDTLGATNELIEILFLLLVPLLLLLS